MRSTTADALYRIALWLEKEAGITTGLGHGYALDYIVVRAKRKKKAS